MLVKIFAYRYIITMVEIIQPYQHGNCNLRKLHLMNLSGPYSYGWYFGYSTEKG